MRMRGATVSWSFSSGATAIMSVVKVSFEPSTSSQFWFVTLSDIG
jgi:hypothetical protein